MNQGTKYFLTVIFAGGILLSVTVFSFMFGFFKLPLVENFTNNVAGLTTKNTNLSSENLPVRLTIPSINVDAKILQVGLVPDGSVDVLQGPDDVAWFNRGPLPGQRGSAVIVGHYGQWQNGANSVFDNLNKLKKGDIISVKNDKGVITSFAVREIHTYNPQDIVPDIFNKNDGTYLNLITCSGTWIPGKQTYNKRLVIFADLVRP